MENNNRGKEQKLEKAPIGSTDGKGKDAEVIVKYFNPCGSGTWLITEGEKQPDGNWLLFGYCHLFEWEWGYVSLEELQSVKLPFGLTIERDLYVKDSATVRDLCDEEPEHTEPAEHTEEER